MRDSLRSVKNRKTPFTGGASAIGFVASMTIFPARLVGPAARNASAAAAPLEHLHLSCSVLGAKKEPLAVGGRDGLEGGFGGQKQLLVGTGSVAAQDLFDLAPHGLDRIEIRRIRRQIEQSGAGGFDDF